MSGSSTIDLAGARAWPPLAAWPDIACQPDDAETFYPTAFDGHETAAVAICRRCPARRPCLAWALATGQRHGVWGGKTPNQRSRITRDRATARRPEVARG